MSGIRTKDNTHEPRKRPAQARSRATVDAIVEAAAQVFAVLGHAQTTTDGIAERAGVSIGTLYQYFPNKDALLVALFERHLAEVEVHFQALCHTLGNANTDEAVTDMVQRLYALHRSSPALHRIFIETAPLPARLLESYRALEHGLRSAWTAHLHDLVPEPAAVATMLTSLAETLAHRYTLYPAGDLDPTTVEAESITLLKAYLTAHRRSDE